MGKKAVVLLSGGLDSAVTAAIARELGFSIHALTVSYGQRHAVETQAASRVAKSLCAADHRCLSVDLRGIGGSALTADTEVPKGRSSDVMTDEIPVTYVPARNTVLLSLALAYAESIDASDLFIGVNAVDYSGYPDCRPEFLHAFELLARLATRGGIEGAVFRLHAPLATLSKADIIQRGVALGVDFSLTHSCYDPTAGGKACGNCDSCILRRKGFAEAGINDPAAYVA